MLSEEKAATLPRKSGGMFVKAHHQTGNRKPTMNLKNSSSNQMIRESFVDDGNGGGILVETEIDENLPKTQTLPRSYKTGMSGSKNRNAPSTSPDQVAIPIIPNRPIGRAQSTNR